EGRRSPRRLRARRLRPRPGEARRVPRARGLEAHPRDPPVIPRNNYVAMSIERVTGHASVFLTNVPNGISKVPPQEGGPLFGARQARLFHETVPEGAAGGNPAVLAESRACRSGDDDGGSTSRGPSARRRD